MLEKEETEELKRFDEPGLILIGFKPMVLLKKHHHLRPSLFVYPEESLVNGECIGSLFMYPEESLVNGECVDNLFLNLGESLVSGELIDQGRTSACHWVYWAMSKWMLLRYQQETQME